jgi:hypothetical protein
VTYVDSNTTDVPTYKTGLATDFLRSRIVPPVAVDDSTFGAIGGSVKVNVIDNDKCVGQCDPRTVVVTTQPTKGTAVANLDGTITYTPKASFTGSDSLKYTVRDTTTGAAASNIATVNIGVLAAPPAVKDAAVAITEVVTGIDVTGNDGNCPAGACTVTITTPAMAGATVVPNRPNVGQVTYLSAPGYTGPDSFSYTATNAAGTSLPAKVSVTVQASSTRDVVTIAKASYSGGQLAMSGTVTAMNGVFPKTLTLFTAEINASWTACMGTNGKSVPVDKFGKWNLSVSGLVGPIDACMQSPNYGVAYVEFTGP